MCFHIYTPWCSFYNILQIKRFIREIKPLHTLLLLLHGVTLSSCLCKILKISQIFQINVSHKHTLVSLTRACAGFLGPLETQILIISSCSLASRNTSRAPFSIINQPTVYSYIILYVWLKQRQRECVSPRRSIRRGTAWRHLRLPVVQVRMMQEHFHSVIIQLFSL